MTMIKKAIIRYTVYKSAINGHFISKERALDDPEKSIAIAMVYDRYMRMHMTASDHRKALANKY
jgi:hypothetical protein